MKRKPLAALIIAQMKKSPHRESERGIDSLDDIETESDAMDEGLIQAADEALQAIDASDAEALAAALKAFFEQC